MTGLTFWHYLFIGGVTMTLTGLILSVIGFLGVLCVNSQIGM